MSHQMMITLTDQEYAALQAEAERSGQPLEALVHAALAPLMRDEAPTTAPMTEREFAEYLFRKGVTMNVATHEPLDPDEEAELEALAQLFSGGKPASEMV